MQRGPAGCPRCLKQPTAGQCRTGKAAGQRVDDSHMHVPYVMRAVVHHNKARGTFKGCPSEDAPLHRLPVLHAENILEQGVWASMYNERAMLSMRKVGIDFRDIRMAVLVQRVVPAAYAFVIHTTNPSNGAPHKTTHRCWFALHKLQMASDYLQMEHAYHTVVLKFISGQLVANQYETLVCLTVED